MSNVVSMVDMCQIEHIDELDCSDYFDKIIERLLFILRDPIAYASIFAKKIKSLDTKKPTDVKKQHKKYSGQNMIKNTINSTSDGFREGDVVRIRSKEQIQETLDENHKLKGCLFMEEMWQYCGTKHRILKKVDSFYDEANRRMCKARNIVLLDGVYCSGQFQRYKKRCDRCCLLFWKEEWLEKTE